MHHRHAPRSGLLAVLLLGLAGTGHGREQADFSQCRWQPLPFRPVPVDAPWTAQADRVSGQPGRQLQLDGQMVLQGQGMYLESRQARMDLQTQTLELNHPLLLQSAVLGLRAEHGRLQQKPRSLFMENVRYWLQQSRGQGRAGRLEMQGRRQARLERFSFSSCDPQAPQWQLRARSVRLDLQRGVGQARHARLHLLGLPLFYTPWMRFPLDDRRQSGLLFPTLQYNEDTGFDYRQPLYWNLAPNRDLTLTPRYTARRGTLLALEYRYLYRNHRGQWQGALLPEDRLDGQRRYLFDWRHNGRLGGAWRWRSRLFDVSDPNYFRDFGNSPSRTVLSYQRSHLTLDGRWTWGELRLLADRYSILDATIGERQLPWRRLPSLEGRWQYQRGGWSTGLDAEWVRFDHDVLAGGKRHDINLWLGWERWRPGHYLRAKGRWRQTGYRMDDSQRLDRGLSIFSLDTGLVLEKRTDRWRKTLEPRLFALYVPRKNQQNLPLFDTTEPRFSFQQLFRENRFSGVDRQSDAASVTLAVSHRWLQADTGRERLTLQLGQTLHLRNPTVGLRESRQAGRRSPWALQLDYRRGEKPWHFSANVVQSTGTAEADKYSFRISRTLDRQRFFQLGYRFQSERLEQLDLFTAWPVRPGWRLLGRLNWSLMHQRNLDSFLGLEYESCCLQARLVLRRYALDDLGRGNQRSAMFFEIGLKGLGSLGRSAEDLLQRSLFDRI